MKNNVISWILNHYYLLGLITNVYRNMSRKMLFMSIEGEAKLTRTTDIFS